MNVEVRPLIKKTTEIVVENLPTITSHGAAVGVVGSVLLMHSADKKANDIINKENPTTLKEKMLLTWKYYIPVVTSTGITIALIFTSDRMWHKKYLDMAGAYVVTKKAYDDYREETKKEVGEKKEAEIHKEATEKTINSVGTAFDERFLVRCGWGNSLFIESSTGQIIIGNKESIKEIYNKLNHRMISSNGEPEVSVTEMCEEFGLRYVCGSGERGWNANYTGMIEPKFAEIVHINGDPDLPATIIGYYQEPKDNFGRDLYV